VNLLANAVKFTDAGGQVSLDWGAAAPPEEATRLDRGAPWLKVRVIDTGIGIPPERLDELFAPFGQIHDPERGRGGTGLGLAISRDLARLMGGDITVRSEPGVGSTFSLWLRAAP